MNTRPLTLAISFFVLTEAKSQDLGQIQLYYTVVKDSYAMAMTFAENCRLSSRIVLKLRVLDALSKVPNIDLVATSVQLDEAVEIERYKVGSRCNEDYLRKWMAHLDNAIEYFEAEVKKLK